jgi:hypothetical protein
MPAGLSAHGDEQPVDGGGAHAHQSLSDLPVKGHASVSFHGSNERRHQPLEPLATQTVCGLPDADQCLMHGFTVQALAGALLALTSWLFRQNANRVLAVKPGQASELVEDPPAFRLGSSPISSANRSD